MPRPMHMLSRRSGALLLLAGAAAVQVAASTATQFDYVIVGGGIGGLVLANRLSENESVSVAVVEAGTFAEPVAGNTTTVPGYDDTFLQIPQPPNVAAIEWNFSTTPQESLNGTSVIYTRGKALGGSSLVNYMAYSHSSVGAFQLWADTVDDQSWTYDNIRPYYLKSMNFTPPDNGTRWANSTPAYPADEVVSTGPLGVSFARYAQSWSSWVAEALIDIGVPKGEALVNGMLNGSMWQLNTIDGVTGTRASADVAYLYPVLGRKNLVIFDHTLGERILFDRTKTATGVLVSNTTSGATYVLSAKREVLLAAGAFQSPQLLQVSGVGPAAALEKLGIPVVANRPGVGQSLNDQMYTGITYRVNVETASALSVGDNLQIAVDEFVANATGPLSSPGGDYTGFEKVPADLRANWSAQTIAALAEYPADWPELEYLVLPTFPGGLNIAAPHLETIPPTVPGADYATVLTALLTPQSRGTVSIASASMRDAPIIDPAWLTNDTDVEVLVAGIKRIRQLFASPVLQPVLIGDEFFPGSAVQTDEEIAAWVRINFGPLFHASSTCRMGKTDDDYAVVDSQARVIGVKNLRVVDNSAMPFLLPGPGPQTHIYMLAEKIADVIKSGL